MDKLKYLELKNYVVDKMAASKSKLHDWGHVKRVKDNALKIVKVLNFQKEVDKNLLKAICLLHDLTFVDYRPGIITYFLEPFYIKKQVVKVFSRIEVNQKDQDIIVEAVVNHPFSMPFKKLHKSGNVYTKILQDADTIDYFSQERQAKIVKAKAKIWFYKFKKFLADKVFGYGRSNLARYLNYPEIAGFFY